VLIFGCVDEDSVRFVYVMVIVAFCGGDGGGRSLEVAVGGLVKVEDEIVMVLWLFMVVEVMNVVVYGG
jgi:hypothetical protein